MRWLAVLALCGGCSVLNVERAPSRPWVSRPECTTSRSTVKKDLLIGVAGVGVGLVLIVIGASMKDPDPDNPLEMGSNELNGPMLAGAITMMGSSIVFGGSAGYGLKATTKCRKAHAAYDRGER